MFPKVFAMSAIISTFVAVKRFTTLVSLLWLTIFGVLTASRAQVQAGPRSQYYDSVEVSLLTCSPHEEVYSLYGHTALRFRDMHNATDVVLNWGTFDYNTPHFVLRFIFGLTDYELGLQPYDNFCDYYRHWGSMVTEQVLNLTPDEKVSLQRLIGDNLQDDNRVYRYNFFYDNCSTRPRDIVERAILGKVSYEPREGYAPTFRQMIHQKVEGHPWTRFGNDMLLGLRADRSTTRQQQEFLPENLLYDFDHATIVAPDGSVRPLVASRRMAVEPGVQLMEPGFPMSPIACGAALLVVSLLVAVAEWKRRRTYPLWDAALMAMTGLAGCLLFVMVFSQHPTTTLNLQLLLVNPIHLFYLPSVLRRKKTSYWTVLLTMTSLLLLGSLLQHYAEGIVSLALSLLIRWWSHHFCDQSTQK